MAFTVEDGTGVAGANSYGTVAEADAYAVDRGKSGWPTTASPDVTALKEQALVRASAAVDAQFSGSFPGWRTRLRAQGLEWPRTDAYDVDDNLIPADEVPAELQHATFEAAIREYATPGSMMPDLERGGAIKRVRAGSVEVEYADGATPSTVFTIIGGLLRRILRAGFGPFAGRATRV